MGKPGSGMRERVRLEVHRVRILEFQTCTGNGWIFVGWADLEDEQQVDCGRENSRGMGAHLSDGHSNIPLVEEFMTVAGQLRLASHGGKRVSDVGEVLVTERGGL